MSYLAYKARLFYAQENKLAGSILNFPEDKISILNYITRLKHNTINVTNSKSPIENLIYTVYKYSAPPNALIQAS